jgi:hypothetical protein
MLIDKRQHSSIIDVGSCTGAGSDTGCYLVLNKTLGESACEENNTANVSCHKNYLKKVTQWYERTVSG